jgi:hypothetical protein
LFLRQQFPILILIEKPPDFAAAIECLGNKGLKRDAKNSNEAVAKRTQTIKKSEQRYPKALAAPAFCFKI